MLCAGETPALFLQNTSAAIFDRIGSCNLVQRCNIVLLIFFCGRYILI